MIALRFSVDRRTLFSAVMVLTIYLTIFGREHAPWRPVTRRKKSHPKVKVKVKANANAKGKGKGKGKAKAKAKGKGKGKGAEPAPPAAASCISESTSAITRAELAARRCVAGSRVERCNLR